MQKSAVEQRRMRLLTGEEMCVLDLLKDPQMKTHRRPLLDLLRNNSWIRNVKDIRL